MRRPDYQRTRRGDYVKQVTDPTTGKRERVRAATIEGLFSIVAAKRDLVARVEHGIATPGDVALLRAVGKPPLRVADAWAEYLPTLRPGWARIAPSVFKHHIAPFFGELACADVTDARLEAWAVERVAKGYAPKTIEVAWFGLRAALRFQVQAGKLAKLPFERFVSPRDGRDLFDRREVARSFEEVLALVRVASEADARTRRWRPRSADVAVRILVMFYLGLRQAELSALGWDDLDLEPKAPLLPSVRIRHQVLMHWRTRHPEWDRPRDPVKGKRVVAVLLHETAVVVLLAHRERLRELGAWSVEGPVFPSHLGAWRTSPASIDPERFRGLVRRAGLPNPERWTVHSLRHSTATLEMLGSGFNIQAVQRRLRHANASTTWGYAHLLQRGAVPSALPGLASSATMPLLPPPLPALAPGDIERSALLVNRLAAPPPRPVKPLSFRAAWAGWVAELGGLDAARASLASDASLRPVGVTEQADAAYRRAYSLALRRSDRREAKRKGNEARRNLLAAWLRFARRQ